MEEIFIPRHVMYEVFLLFFSLKFFNEIFFRFFKNKFSFTLINIFHVHHEHVRVVFKAKSLPLINCNNSVNVKF